jgi:hypothetical protein
MQCLQVLGDVRLRQVEPLDERARRLLARSQEGEDVAPNGIR